MTTRDELREKVARAIFERRHKGLKNVWSWEDSGLDDEHPGVRASLLSDADAALAVVRAELAEPSEAMMQRASDAIAWAYAESDWEEAKEMAEDLDPRVIYDAIFAASPLAEPGA